MLSGNTSPPSMSDCGDESWWNGIDDDLGPRLPQTAFQPMNQPFFQTQTQTHFQNQSQNQSQFQSHNHPSQPMLHPQSSAHRQAPSNRRSSLPPSFPFYPHAHIQSHNHSHNHRPTLAHPPPGFKASSPQFASAFYPFPQQEQLNPYLPFAADPFLSSTLDSPSPCNSPSQIQIRHDANSPSSNSDLSHDLTFSSDDLAIFPAQAELLQTDPVDMRVTSIVPSATLNPKGYKSDIYLNAPYSRDFTHMESISSVDFKSTINPAHIAPSITSNTGGMVGSYYGDLASPSPSDSYHTVSASPNVYGMTMAARSESEPPSSHMDFYNQSYLHDSPPSHSFSAAEASARRRNQVKVACIHCKRSCKKCDESRPCGRCVKLGLEKTCIDAPRKERKNAKVRRLSDDQGAPDYIKFEYGGNPAYTMSAIGYGFPENLNEYRTIRKNSI